MGDRRRAGGDFSGISMFGQTFSAADLATVAVLVVLEGTLSIDNALVLGILARRLPSELRVRALSYGLFGAFILRAIVIAAAAFLMRWPVINLIGGLYLIWIAVKYFWRGETEPDAEGVAESGQRYGFWETVAAIEFTDLIFAVDSILAAIALVGPPPAGMPADSLHPKLWVVVTGGMLGVILMRFAAFLITRLLERFKNLSFSAYLLVLLIGIKLVIDWAMNGPEHPDRVDFQNPRSIAFWIFWVAMAGCLAIGFIPRRDPVEAVESPATGMPEK